MKFKLLIAIIIISISACRDEGEEPEKCRCHLPSGQLCKEEDFHKCEKGCSKTKQCPAGEKCYERITNVRHEKEEDTICFVDDPECEVIKICKLCTDELLCNGYYLGCRIALRCNAAEFEDGRSCYFDYQCRSRDCEKDLGICIERKNPLGRYCYRDLGCESGNCDKKTHTCRENAPPKENIEPCIVTEGYCKEGYVCMDICKKEKEGYSCLDRKCIEKLSTNEQCDPGPPLYGAICSGLWCKCETSSGSPCEKEDFRCRGGMYYFCLMEDECSTNEKCLEFNEVGGLCYPGHPDCEFKEYDWSDKDPIDGVYSPKKMILWQCDPHDYESGTSCSPIADLYIKQCKKGECWESGVCK